VVNSESAAKAEATVKQGQNQSKNGHKARVVSNERGHLYALKAALNQGQCQSKGFVDVNEAG
jgi:small-conductance mechanosensitive channel